MQKNTGFHVILKCNYASALHVRAYFRALKLLNKKKNQQNQLVLHAIDLLVTLVNGWQALITTSTTLPLQAY